MGEKTIPGVAATAGARDHPLTRSVAGMIGIGVLGVLIFICVGSLPWTLTRYNEGNLDAYLLPPTWAMDLPDRWFDPEVWDAPATAPKEPEVRRYYQAARQRAQRRLAEARRTDLLPPGWTTMTDADREQFIASMNGREPVDVQLLIEGVSSTTVAAFEPTPEQISEAAPDYLLGTDRLGRDLFIRSLAGGGVSIGVGLSAATISVVIGTLYGALAGYIGGRTDSVMMRIVDVLYGLPYILLVVLLAVAGDALLDEYISKNAARTKWILAEARQAMPLDDSGLPGKLEVEVWLEEHPEVRTELESRADTIPRLQRGQISAGLRSLYEVGILLLAIGGVSWLTMARVIRGQVLSLKEQPFMEAARAIGAPIHRLFLRHLLPNLLGPIIVYATLTVPQAILQESFLSFLGIGVKPPLPSWGNLAADGLIELNTFKSRWWLLLFPCLLLGVTLLALNFVGEGLREAFDPKRARK